MELPRRPHAAAIPRRQDGSPTMPKPRFEFADFFERAQHNQRVTRAVDSRPSMLARDVFARFRNNNDSLWASALTYTTGLSIVPVLAVGLSILNGLGETNRVRPIISRYLTANSPDITNQLLSFVSNVSASTLGAVGAAALLITVVLTIGTVERAFNSMFHVPRGRSILRKFADYVSVTVTLPLLLAAGGAAHQAIARHVPSGAAFGYLASGSGLWAGFFFLYIFFPNTHVRWVPAAIGALAASIMLQLGQWGFIHFQVGIGKYHVIYGALSAVPILLTWIYMSWIIVLLGGELTAALEGVGGFGGAAGALRHDAWRGAALTLMTHLGERMAGQRDAVTTRGLAMELGISEEGLAEIIARLKDAGLVVESAKHLGAHDHGLFLARDSAVMPIADVFHALRTDGPAIPLAPHVSAVIEELRRSERTVLEKILVADLAVLARQSFPPHDRSSGNGLSNADNPPPAESTVAAADDAPSAGAESPKRPG